MEAKRVQLRKPYSELRAFHAAIEESTRRLVTFAEFESDRAAGRIRQTRFEPDQHQTRSHPDEAFDLLTSVLMATRSALMSVVVQTVLEHLPKGAKLVAAVHGEILVETTSADVLPPTLLASAITEAVNEAFLGFPLLLDIGTGRLAEREP